MNQDEEEMTDEQTDKLINEIEIKVNTGGKGGGVVILIY